jgi:hypothetical protein
MYDGWAAVGGALVGTAAWAIAGSSATADTVAAALMLAAVCTGGGFAVGHFRWEGVCPQSACVMAGVFCAYQYCLHRALTVLGPVSQAVVNSNIGLIVAWSAFSGHSIGPDTIGLAVLHCLIGWRLLVGVQPPPPAIYAPSADQAE